MGSVVTLSPPDSREHAVDHRLELLLDCLAAQTIWMDLPSLTVGWPVDSELRLRPGWVSKGGNSDEFWPPVQTFDPGKC